MTDDGARLSRRQEFLILTAIGIIFALVSVWLIARGAPLGHDESVYALKARTIVDGSTSAYFWNDYRAPGLPVALGGAAMLTGSDAMMRLTVVIFGGLLVVLTWWVGRMVYGPGVGLIAAAGAGLTPTILASTTAVWPDVPGAALGLGVLAILLATSSGDRVSWWVLAAAPLAVLATIFRFGAPLPIGIGAVGIAIWRWPAVRHSLGRVGSLAAVTLIGIGVVLAVPATLGAATSPLESIGRLSSTNDFPIYQGLIDYAQLYDFLLLTPAGVVLVIGLAWAVGLKANRSDGRWLLVAGIGLVTALAIALTLHGEYRYLSPAYPWLWIASAAGFASAFTRLHGHLATSAVAVLAVAVILAGFSDGAIEVSKNKDRFLAIRTAARQIDNATEDLECGVITGYVPQVAWYSRCITTSYSTSNVRLTSESFPEDPATFLFFVQDGKRQPEGDLLQAYRDAVDGACSATGSPSDGPLEYVEVCPVEP